MNGWPSAFAETCIGGIDIARYPTIPSLISPNPCVYGNKDLNLLHSYASDKFVSVSEHVQNWRDRCVEVAEALSNSFDVSVHFQTVQQQSNDWTIYTFTFENFVVGWIALKSLPNTCLHIEFYNASTALTPDNVLVMGQTSKRFKSLAGYFGEGVKVEINRLLDSGAHISYFTNSSVWIFYYDQGVLHASIQPHASHGTGTLIQITNAPPSSFNPNNYLFLQPSLQKIASKANMKEPVLSGLEILFDHHFKGKVYVQGIYIMNMIDASKVPFGLNYFGRCIMQKLEIGRDRNSLKLYTITPLIADVFFENTSDTEVLQSLAGLFYQTLPAFKSERYSFSYDAFKLNSSKPANVQFMANILLEYFFHANGSRNCLPCQHIAPNLKREAELFGYTAVKVDTSIMEWLREAENCPTLQSFWEDNKNSVLALPEYVFDEVHPTYPVSAILNFSSPEVVHYAQSIRQLVSAYFDNAAVGKMLRFKDFSSLSRPNTRRFIPIKSNPTSTDVDVCVLDVQLLDSSLVHEEYRRKDSLFRCEGNCGCVTNIIIDDILTCISDAERQSLDTKFRRRFLNTLPTNLPCPPSISRESSAPAPDEIGTANSATSGNKIPDASTKTTKTSKLSQQKQQVNNSNNQRSRKKGESANPNNESVLLSCLAKDCRHLAQECCTMCVPSGESSDHSNGIQDDDTVDEQDWFDKCEISRDAASMIVQYDTLTGIPIYLTDNVEARLQLQSLTSHNEQHRAIPFLYHCIQFLASNVFQYPTSQCHLFLENSGTIAFNFRCQLYFNIRSMVPFLEEDPKACLHFWFSVFAHEVTHNKVKNHNAKFAGIYGYVVSFYIDKYHAALTRLGDIAPNNWSIFMERFTM